MCHGPTGAFNHSLLFWSGNAAAAHIWTSRLGWLGAPGSGVPYDFRDPTPSAVHSPRSLPAPARLVSLSFGFASNMTLTQTLKHTYTTDNTDKHTSSIWSSVLNRFLWRKEINCFIYRHFGVLLFLLSWLLSQVVTNVTSFEMFFCIYYIFYFLEHMHLCIVLELFVILVIFNFTNYLIIFCCLVLKNTPLVCL